MSQSQSLPSGSIERATIMVSILSQCPHNLIRIALTPSPTGWTAVAMRQGQDIRTAIGPNPEVALANLEQLVMQDIATQHQSLSQLIEAWNQMIEGAENGTHADSVQPYDAEVVQTHAEDT